MNQNERWNPQSPLVTAPELPELAARHPVLVIHCGAVWNGVDQRADAILQPIRREFASRISVYALDVDDEINWEFLREIPVLNIPAFVGFVSGKRLPTVTGARSDAFWREHFQEWLALANTAPENTPV